MIGSFSLFFLLFLLFVKVAPAISIAEVKEEVNPPRRREPEAQRVKDSQGVGGAEGNRAAQTDRQRRTDGKPRVVGVFPFLDDVRASLARVEKTVFHIEDIYSPTPCHEIQEALRTRPSPIRYFTLIGGGVGALLGLALATYAHVSGI